MEKTKQQEVVERFAASCRGRNDKRNVLMLPKQYCDVLVLTSMRGYIYRKSMIPVIRELSKNLSVLVLNCSTPPAERSELAKEIQCIGVDFDFFASENRPPPSDEALKILQECAKELLTYFRDNLRSCPLILAEHALLTYASLIPRMYGYAEAVWEVADSYCRTGFGCLIVSPGRTFESRLFVRRARAWGIRSIDLQVGTLNSAPKFLPPIADRVLAQDPVSLNLFRNHFQIEDSRIVLVGAPKSDDLISSFGSLSKEDARKKLGLSTDVDGGPIILFTSQPFSEALMGAIFRLVCDAGARTILKLHPAETPQREEFYRSIVDEIGASERVSIVRDGNTFEYIRAVDVVATYCSGTAIEAFQLDRPVLMVNPFDEPPPFDLYSLGVAYRVRTAGEIADLSHAELEKPGSIAALFDGPVILEQRELMRSIADGKAVDRILREVNLAQAETRLTKHMDNTTVLIETEWRRH